MGIVAEHLDTLVTSHKTACCPQTFGVGEATTTVQIEWLKVTQTHLTSIQMKRHIKNNISTSSEEAGPDTTMTET